MTSHIVTGEKIQLLCDHILSTWEDFNYNPLLKKIALDKFVDLDKLSKPFDNKRIIFCYTHSLGHELITKLHYLKNDFVLIFHNSDHSFREEHLVLFCNLNLKHIYTQNCEVVHENVTPLPIGIANSMWGHGDLSIWEKVLPLLKSRKTRNIYFYFNTLTNSDKRERCFRIIKEQLDPVDYISDYYEYLSLLSTYKYAICPEGNGLDTHRFWECLYLGVIPICLRNNVTEYYSKKVPMVLLNDWTQFNKKTLEHMYAIYDWAGSNTSMDFIEYKKNITYII